MKKRSFKELTEGFQRLVPEPSLAEGHIFHYYKLFQHAVNYYIIEDTHKLIPGAFRQSASMVQLKFRLRAMLRPSINPKLRPLVVLDDRRTIDTPEGPKAYYFYKLLKDLPREAYSVVTDSPNSSAFSLDLQFEDWPKLGNSPLNRAEKRVLKDLYGVLKKARTAFTNDPGLIPYLESVMLVFFESFHRSYQLLKGQGVKRLVLTCHYHHEGLVAAARLLGIQVLEFQHGLIARQDLYYVYPKAVGDFADRALFPDRLFVFGSYWRNLVLEGGEFRPEQVQILGDYSLQSIGRARYQGSKKEKSILIGTQKNMPDTYIPYTERLLTLLENKYPEWKVWVKLHPLEKVPEAYAHLNKHPQCAVYGKSDELMPLLCATSIQISVYSTTFYDALGLGVINFSLQRMGSEDYAAEMVNEQVAFALMPDDDPVAKAELLAPEDLLNVVDVYAAFNPDGLPWLRSQ